MYFPGDPLLASTRSTACDQPAAERLVATFDSQTTPERRLGYRCDIVLRGPRTHADGGPTTSDRGTDPPPDHRPLLRHALGSRTTTTYVSPPRRAIQLPARARRDGAPPSPTR